MPVELLSVTEAAREFLTKSGYAFAQLQRADFDSQKKQWSLVFDVGWTSAKLKTILIDETGKVVGFE